eukprot:jgi/Psemu1/283879/fgenesh1_pg.35_\
MILRPMGTGTTRSLSGSLRVFQVGRRSLATSAQKRKWLKEQGTTGRPFRKNKHAAVLAAEEALPKAAAPNWGPLFFLGVFPVFLSIVVVLNRDDLREEVNDKGIGRFVEDYKRWRWTPPLSSPANLPSTEQQIQQQQLEHESEYERMLIQLDKQKDNISAPATGSNSSDP